MGRGYRIVMIGGLIAIALLAAMASKEVPKGSLLRRTAEKGGHTHTGAEGHRLLAEGTEAPQFRLTLVRGGQLALADLKGSYVVLVFVTRTCPYCKQFKERLLGMGLSDVNSRLVFITPKPAAEVEVELTDEQQELERVLSATFPVLQDSARTTAKAYNAFPVPTTYLIDEKGVVVASAVGLDEGVKLVDRLIERET